MPAQKNKTTNPTSRPMRLGGHEILLAPASLPIGKVSLDPDNPRLRRIVQEKFGDRSPSQDELRKLILNMPGVSDLQKSIRDNGGLLEEIYVTASGLVVEGNCRTAVFMHLHAGRHRATFSKIPVLRFPKSATREQIAIFQGIHHISSVKTQWGKYERSQHLHHMHRVLGMDTRRIARDLSMTEPNVKRELEKFRQMTMTLPKSKPKPKPKLKPKNSPTRSKKPKETSTKTSAENAGAGTTEQRVTYSYWDVLLTRKELKDFASTEKNKTWFRKLVKSGKFNKAADVYQLPAILKNRSATKALETSGFDAAMKIVASKDPTASSPLLGRVEKLTKELGKVQRSGAQAIKNDKASKQLLLNLTKAIQQVLK